MNETLFLKSMDDTGIPTNVSYSQHGFSQPPMINTGGAAGGLGSGGMGPMSSPVSGPTSPGMSSGMRSGFEVLGE